MNEGPVSPAPVSPTTPRASADPEQSSFIPECQQDDLPTASALHASFQHDSSALSRNPASDQDQAGPPTEPEESA